MGQNTMVFSKTGRGVPLQQRMAMWGVLSGHLQERSGQWVGLCQRQVH